MLNTVLSATVDQGPRPRDHSNHIGAFNRSLKMKSANTMIAGLSSFSSLSASSKTSSSSTPTMNNPAHHIQPPPAISITAELSDSKAAVHGHHSPGTCTSASSSHDTPSICNTDTAVSIATNDVEGSSSLPIDLTRSNSQTMRNSLHSSAASSMSNSQSTSPSNTMKRSPNPLHNPVVNSVADLTIGRSKPLSNGALNGMHSSHGLKRRMQSHSTGSPRAKRPKLDHVPNGVHGAGRGMMNLLNLHNPGTVDSGHRSNAPNTNPLVDFRRSLLAGKQQQHRQQGPHRTAQTPGGFNLTNPNAPTSGLGSVSAGNPNSKKPVALTLQQLINYLGKNNLNIIPNGNAPANLSGNTNAAVPQSASSSSSSSSFSSSSSSAAHKTPTPPHSSSRGMVPPNHSSIPSTTPSAPSSSRVPTAKSIGLPLTAQTVQKASQQAALQNLVSQLKNANRGARTKQALINLIKSKGLNGSNIPSPSLAALTRSARQYAVAQSLRSGNGQSVHSRTHNLRPTEHSKNTPPVFTVSNSANSVNSVHSSRPNVRPNLSNHHHPSAAPSGQNGRALMTLLQTISNHSAAHQRALGSNGVGAKALSAKYSNILNAPNTVNAVPSVNSSTPNAIAATLHGLKPHHKHHSTSRSMSGSQSNSLSNSRTASPFKKREIEVVTLLSDDDDDEEEEDEAANSLRKSTAIANSHDVDRHLNSSHSRDHWLPPPDSCSPSIPSTTIRSKEREKKRPHHKRRDAENAENAAKHWNAENVENAENVLHSNCGEIEGVRSKSRTKKRKDRRDRSSERERKRKRKRSPSATSVLSGSSLVSDTRSQCTTGSDESYKAEGSHETVTRRQRRKRTCNIDKEFDAEEQRIKLAEDTVHTVSGNAYIVAYAESLHLDELQMRKGEVFPVLRGMPRSALIAYCEYYKLRHSKRSKDNRLLQIVTKHFILHNREKNGMRSIEDMERDLFWHSVCHSHNSCGAESEEKKECVTVGGSGRPRAS